MSTRPANTTEFDVVVVGGGNAALCAAIAARKAGARTLVLERAPVDERGGNSRFTAGAMRFAFASAADVHDLIHDLSGAERERLEFGSYDADVFYDDMLRLTSFRTDPDLANTLVSQSLDAMTWLRDRGVRFVPNGRQAFPVDGRLRFWGGLVIDTSGGGPGLVDALYAAAHKAGVDVWYESRATSLVADDSGVHGVRLRRSGSSSVVQASSVVLAAGGFEANPEMRTRYLGPGWDLAKVRGSRFNTGDAISMALEIGAAPWGNWSGGHAVFWDQNAPAFGDLSVGDGFSKLSYPLGILVNALGERFVDEGADFRNYTYAKYGKEVLHQPGSFAWQVFDAKVLPLLRDEYRIRRATRIRAGSLEELAEQMEGVDGERFLETILAFNAAVDRCKEFDPTVKDGKATVGVLPPKSNWALEIDTPPFEAYAVTCGITFTFGGLHITPDRAEVLDDDGSPIPGLYAAGELVGGLFYGNYPGGAGLTAGAVFGRIAGEAAARFATSRTERGLGPAQPPTTSGRQ